jgi:2-isopropylmalate synthase
MDDGSPPTDAPMMDVIFDWNEVAHQTAVIRPGFELVDETLRDGIQSPSIRNPTIEEKIEILHLMEACGIEVADIGLPGTGVEAVEHVTRLCEEIRDNKMAIKPNCAARTHPADIQAIIEISQKTGVEIEICAFLGASPIRRILEGWDPERMIGMTTSSAKLAADAGLPFSFVTEDTTRSDPQMLSMLFRAAIDHGASRLVLTDTVGHATPDGLRNLVTYTQGLIRSVGADVQIDWHGHNDRGLSLTLCLSALEHGVHRVHGTCLGVGERVGNASIDMLLVNLKMLGIIDRDLTALGQYVERVSETFEVPVPYNYPVFGHDAYRTATGVHASAIVKAMESDSPDFADRVYSSVPASDYGREQIIEVGYCSGKANVQCWLRQRDIEVTDQRVASILEHAKNQNKVLTNEEIFAYMRETGLFSPDEVRPSS